MFKTRDGMIKVISATAAVTALTIGGIAVAPMLSGCSAISQLDKKGVAATFDGGDITEDEVSRYIADYRRRMDSRRKAPGMDTSSNLGRLPTLCGVPQSTRSRSVKSSRARPGNVESR